MKMGMRNEDHSTLHSCFDLKGSRLPIFLVAITVFLPGCIEPYISPVVAETKILSIEGSLIKGDSIQIVKVHRTATLAYPKPSFIEGCEVKVVDDLNNEFLFEDRDKGEYSIAIPDEGLVYGRDYKLIVVTPDGLVYESEYEKLYSNSEVDSIYYEVEESTRTYTEFDYWGLQYYLDIVAPDTTSRYYRWKLTETYEYTSTGSLSFIIVIVDEVLDTIFSEDIWDLYRCWNSKKVPGTYISNTNNLTLNEKKKIPLNYVSNRTDRLKIMYSLLVEQYAISEGAYKYWKQHNVALEGSSGLYNTQPGQPITNLYCSDDCDKRVLGYFWVSSKTERRIFTPRIASLPIYEFDCPTYVYDPLEHKLKPRYIRVEKETREEITGHPTCFDCTGRGGESSKPDFWEYKFEASK